VPILPNKPLVVDFGFLPDAGRANFLASKIAEREQYRKEQSLIDMPIPDEWLAAGWPLLARSRIGGSVYLMDGCVVSIADGIAKFGFAGSRVGEYAMVGGIPVGLPISLFNILSDLELGIVAEIEVITSIALPSLPPSLFSTIDLAVAAELKITTRVETVGDSN
jgi:hypothetical protein